MDSEGPVFLSVIAIHEIEKGIARLDHKGAALQSAGLKVWLAGLLASYDDKIIPIDADVAAFAGQLEAKAIAAGYDPGLADAAFAGIVKGHGLTIVTLNTKHFAPFGISVTTPDDAADLGSIS